jgi:hypothetical protein
MATTQDGADARAACARKAREMWAAFTDAEKALVRFGLFPAEKMLAAEREGHDGRLLAVALMECAEADGGMIA